MVDGHDARCLKGVANKAPSKSLREATVITLLANSPHFTDQKQNKTQLPLLFKQTVKAVPNSSLQSREKTSQTLQSQDPHMRLCPAVSTVNPNCPF